MPNPVVIVGCGPAGMASALALSKVGIDVRLYERYPEARPAGNILNLWPPPIRALAEMGVDVEDLGAPCRSSFRNAYTGHVRAEVRLPQDVLAEYHGGFIGLLRPVLFERMLAAMPDGVVQPNRTVTALRDHGDGVAVTFADGEVIETPVLIGADGIDSVVRKALWGDSPKRQHRLHAIGGFTYELPPTATPGENPIMHGNWVQGSYSSIRDCGRDGYQWWIVEAADPDAPAPTDLLAHAKTITAEFPASLRDIIAATPPGNLQRWIIRDRKPLKQWSKGRITLAGDAAHPTSPYAAYGAGMAITDAYVLAKKLKHVDLGDTAAVRAALLAYERGRIRHTTAQVQQAYVLGQVFHHIPRALRPVRDFVLDRTPLLQKQVGERSPREIVHQLTEMGSESLAEV
ncbi:MULTISPECIES: FAD-dependent oxidoreductase [Amycolatopsis]|uniref:FAD-dependent monooxygenase n=1 Tax=Amycolatopsis thermalba TaxID=944492 RepID=A0ABY4NXH0_9PSEU|nr:MULTISPECIES: NAD(P)/FAD-dependent oxidoreductase [Amycolatopsis]OXM72298.1 salicylate hydroxylase [Amycolatopsis sp. KNN50.9b]UQS24779.1 FAD-dependent monooxygenase [Amycolatopsis thermalba]